MIRTLCRYALAETRRSRGTLAFCVVSIAIGVFSLTAVRGILLGLSENLANQSRSIFGADMSLAANEPLDTGVAAALAADLKDAGAEETAMVTFYSMVTRAGGERVGGKSTQLVQLRAIGGGYPLYGEIETDPPGLLGRLAAGRTIVVDPLLFRELGIAAGDRVRVGELELTVAGSFAKTPGTPAASFGLAPAAYIDIGLLEKTGLLQTGSRIRYETFFRTPLGFDVEKWKDAHWEEALDAHLTLKTSREAAASSQRFLRRLSHFLTVVGLVTLLLGGLGIAAAMGLFIRGKLDNAALFRCLGATPRQVFFLYAVLALGVGGLGSVVGTVLGALAPPALGAVAARLGTTFLPAALELRISWSACAHGLVAGLATTAIFALLPIYQMRKVAPLRVLRRHVDVPPLGVRGWVARAAGAAAIALAVLLLAVVETRSRGVALFFTLAVGAALAALALLARATVVLASVAGRRIRSYHLRQGIANLHRPGNQTTWALVSIGLGVLLIATIVIIEASLQKVMAIENRDDIPNLFVIDVQPHQVGGVESILRDAGALDVRLAPMISARIARLGGRAIDRREVARDAAARTWQDKMRTREYFLSYREELIDSETVTEGHFWSGRPEQQEVSISRDLAETIGAKIGETLTLDIQGIELDATITSFRDIRWQAMVPNAMILLSPGEIENAPTLYVASLRLPGERERYALQGDLVAAYPNLSTIDVTDAAAAVRAIVERVAAMLAFLALLTVITGALIVGGTVVAGRAVRRREAMLLKVLGARSGDLLRILGTEYTVLAALGSLSGALLAALLCRVALPLFFSADAVIPYGHIAALVAAVIAMNVAISAALTRGVAKTSPRDILRDD